jgi:hypothetical protein
VDNGRSRGLWQGLPEYFSLWILLCPSTSELWQFAPSPRMASEIYRPLNFRKFWRISGRFFERLLFPNSLVALYSLPPASLHRPCLQAGFLIAGISPPFFALSHICSRCSGSCIGVELVRTCECVSQIRPSVRVTNWILGFHSLIWHVDQTSGF